MDDMSLPTGFQLDEQPVQAAPMQESMQDSHGLPPGFELDENKYGSTGQQAITALEGAGQGALGPLGPFLERRVLGVPRADILARQKENPISHGAGEALGLGAGMLAGTGEAGVMTKAGELANEAAGLGRLAEDASYLHKVGSSVIQQAAEMAVLQGSDETSKMILQDPDTSAQSAIANVGLSAAIGGATGGVLTGVVSPLWKATVGPKIEAGLNSLRDHYNGLGGAVPKEAANAINTLGIEPGPIMRSALSEDPAMIERFNVLKEKQHPQVLEAIDDLHTNASNSVAESLGINPTAVEVHSDYDGGVKTLESFQKEFDNKYKPLQDALNKRDADAAEISIPDEARRHSAGKLIEKAMNAVGTDSPYYKEYENYAQRMMAKDTIGQLDKLKTEINGKMSQAYRAADTNTATALKDIKMHLTDFQEAQIEKQGIGIDKEGFKGKGRVSAQELAQDLIAERKMINNSYRDFAAMSDDLSNHLGIGDFKGAGNLNRKLEFKLSPEEVNRKFSFKGNKDFMELLQSKFPETYDSVVENERKRFLKLAVLQAKGDAAINVKKLNDIISKTMAGQKEYVDAIIPAQAQARIKAANDLLASIPNPKSSGTAGWLTKTMKNVPSGLMAAVGMIADHNPFAGFLIGEGAQALSHKIPDAMNLAFLKWAGSNQPVKAEGMKAMIDFFHNTYKGDNLIAKATKAVLKPGAQVIAANLMPVKADRDKLDKLVTKIQNNPDKFMQAQTQSDVGHYLPDHQAGISKTTTTAVQYLQTLKPQPFKSSPLDKPIEPTKAQQSRYDRALDIAQQPAIVMQHLKDGTLQASDIQDLNAMYPGLYHKMVTQLSNEMNTKTADDEQIPYRTKIGMSLFMGTPLDSTMTPMAIQAAQLTHLPTQKPQGPGKGEDSKHSTEKLGKSNKSYQTPGQAAEADRSNRE